MLLHTILIIAALTLCAFAGGIGLKQFSLTRDVLWLVAGFCAYGISNVLFILVIDVAGIARAMVLASAAQIVLTTAAGVWFGERPGVVGFAAAGLACLAVLLSLAASEAGTGPERAAPSDRSIS